MAKINRSKRKPVTPDITPEPIKYKPEPPAVLGESGRSKWNKSATLLVHEGILNKFNKDTLLMLCLEWERYIDCMKVIRQDGETWTGENGYVQIRPEASQANKSLVQCIKLGSLFGFDPVSLSKLKRPTVVDKVSNEFDGL